jgi:hypothetical protein
MTASKSKHTYASVWQTLSAIDCSDKAEKKNGLTYLSWAWAWGILMEHYPEATYQFLNEEWDSEGRATVWCKVAIGELERLMWLPVMDYKNKAIVKPDTRAVSDTRMRCLTKCLAMYGLGHYIYAGEDLPAQTETAEEATPEPKKAAKPAPEPASNADDTLNILITTFNKFAEDPDTGTKTVANLEDLYRQNVGAITQLQESSPEDYKQLMAHLSAMKAELQSKEEPNA